MRNKRIIALPVWRKPDEMYSDWLKRVKNEYFDFELEWSTIRPLPVQYIAFLTNDKSNQDFMIYS